MGRTAYWVVNRRLVAEWLLCVGLLLALLGYIGYAKYLDRERIAASEQEQLANQARVIEENLASQLVATSRALEGLLTDLASDTGYQVRGAALDNRLKLIADTLTGISPLVITNAQGRITHASVDSVVGFDASKRPYFRKAMHAASQNILHVSPPFVSSQGIPSIALSRAILDTKGQFAGVVAAVLDANFAGVLLDSVRFTADTFSALVDEDGQAFVSKPSSLGKLDVDLVRPGGVFNQHKSDGWSASNFAGVTDATGVVRLVALRTVQPVQLAMDKAMVVLVSRDTSAIYAAWTHEVDLLGTAFGGLSLAVFVALFIYQRRQHLFDDLTDQRDRALRDSDARLQSIFEATPDALRISDAHGAITMVNRQVTVLLGFGLAELLGKPLEALVRMPSLGDPLTPGAALGAINMPAQTAIREYGIAWRKDGGECHVEISLCRIETGEGLFFACALRDMSERKAADEKIRELAFYDQLTGLPNRTMLMDKLGQIVGADHHMGIYGAMLLIDLDHFKTLNNTLGHEVGDMLLQQVAWRLSSCLRESDAVARVGGDEFAVILATLSHNEAQAIQDAEAVAVKILATLQQPYQLGDVSHSGSASIGATIFQGQRTRTEDLLRQADMAMYRAKDSGRNAVHFFAPSMEMAVVNRVALERDLRHAVAAGQFELHYQAQVGALGQVTGAEVLVRWRHPTRGLVSPIDFIPLAEESGVILPLGHWVLETACQQLVQWQHLPGLAHLSLAVNVSALQFAQADFVQRVQAVLNHTGVTPQRLKLELTESLLVGDVADIIGKMRTLKGLGVGFSMDDFGTGYSSLSYLGRLPLDQLKIDRSFVSEVATNPSDADIVRTIIALAQGLGLEVIAEGVETDAQRTFLASAGCHAYQGYLFSRPLLVKDFEAYVRCSSLAA
jgi:diguanylate cyclase (GGDEF)-like protein/PAS domain S-box-containing protein